MRSDGRDRALNVAYLERKLRAVGVVGSSPLQQLEDIQGLLILENDRVEWGWPAQDLRFGGFSFQGAGGATFYGVVGVQNPANSGLLCIVEHAIADTDPATPVNGSFIEVAWATGAMVSRGRVPKDGREPQPIVSGGVELVSSNSQTAGALGLNSITAIPVRQRVDLDIVIPPGSKIVLGGVDNTGARRTNLAFYAGLEWRVRPIEGTSEIK